MNLKRPLATVVLAAGMLCGGSAAASPTSDYPPSGPVVEITGELITGGTVQAVVRSCEVGETLRTKLGSMAMVESVCQGNGSTAFAANAAPSGVSRFDLALPAEPGAVAGEVELVDSGDRLSFLLDVRAQETDVVAIDSPSDGLPGWPFLVLAGLIALFVMIVVSRRRDQQPTP